MPEEGKGLPDDVVARALDFIFDEDQEYYSATKMVWGKPVRLRVLSAQEIQVASLAVDNVFPPSSNIAATVMGHNIFYLAKAIQEIGYVPWIPKGIDPGYTQDDLVNARVQEMMRWPGGLVDAVTKAWQEVTSEFNSFLTEESVGNS